MQQDKQFQLVTSIFANIGEAKIKSIELGYIFRQYINYYRRNTSILEDNILVCCLCEVYKKRMQFLRDGISTFSFRNDQFPKRVRQVRVKIQLNQNSNKKSEAKLLKSAVDQLQEMPKYIERRSHQNSYLSHEKSKSQRSPLPIEQFEVPEMVVFEEFYPHQLDEQPEQRGQYQHSAQTSDNTSEVGTQQQNHILELAQDIVINQDFLDQIMNITLSHDMSMRIDSQAATRAASLRKVKVDHNHVIRTNYKSQFQNDVQIENDKKLNNDMIKYQAIEIDYEIRQLMMKADDDLFDLIDQVLDDQDMAGLSKIASSSSKSSQHPMQMNEVLEIEDSKEIQDIIEDRFNDQFLHQSELDYQLEDIPEESHNHYTMTASYLDPRMFDDGQHPWERARHFYELLKDVNKNADLVMSQEHKESFGHIKVNIITNN